MVILLEMNKKFIILKNIIWSLIYILVIYIVKYNLHIKPFIFFLFIFLRWYISKNIESLIVYTIIETILFQNIIAILTYTYLTYYILLYDKFLSCFNFIKTAKTLKNSTFFTKSINSSVIIRNTVRYIYCI